MTALPTGGFTPRSPLRRRHRSPQPAGFALRVSAQAVAPGGEVSCLLSGLAEPAELAFVRRERGPTGRLSLPCCVVVVEPDGRGAAAAVLSVPVLLPPTSRGSDCSVEFVVRARSPLRGRRAAHVERPVTVATGPPAPPPDSRLADRMIADYPARRFHVELSEAALGGGGRIGGRVHVDRDLGDAAMVVSARCLECWRTSPANLRWRHPPTWSSRTLWAAERRSRLEPGLHWLGFSFDLPGELPPAVEGYAIAWRYEIEARRPTRLGPDERAVITPLRYAIG